MNRAGKIVNIAVNLAIVLAVVLIGNFFARNYLWPPKPPGIEDYRIAAGTTVSLPDMDWAQNGETLLLVLRKGCHFCEESAPFYQRLTKETATIRNLKLVAVLPHEVSDSTQYLHDLKVPINDVRQAGFETLGVKGTPTLILINSKGEVVDSWAGKLPAEKENEVLKRLESDNR